MSTVKKRITKTPAKNLAKAPARKKAQSTTVKPKEQTETTPQPHAPAKLPNSWAHLKRTYRVLRNEWRFFVVLTLVYALLNAIFVHNFTQDVQGLKQQLAPSVGGNPALTGIGTYAFLVTAAGSSGATTAYLYMLLIICSLACIWGLRRHFGNHESKLRLGVRDSFYEGMYPLIPFILVIFVLTLELFPLAAGGSLLGLVWSNGIAVTGIEQTVWLLVFGAFAAVTVWLVSMSLFAPYIVTLPESRPWQALKDSKKITKGRRLAVVRRIVFFGLILLVVSAGILVPVIMLVPGLTGFLVFVFGALLLPFVHTFFYGLYRELLDA